MPNITYIGSIPVAGNNPSTDQPNMTINTDAVATILNQDLYGFNNNNGGYHQKSTYVVQGSNPGSAAAQVVEFSKTAGAFSELFLQRDGVATVSQITAGIAKQGGANTYYQGWLPGGCQIRYGNVTGGTGTITYASMGLDDFPTVCVGVLVTADNSLTPNVLSHTTSQFILSSTPFAVTFLAIGF